MTRHQLDEKTGTTCVGRAAGGVSSLSPSTSVPFGHYLRETYSNYVARPVYWLVVPFSVVLALFTDLGSRKRGGGIISHRT